MANENNKTDMFVDGFRFVIHRSESYHLMKIKKPYPNGGKKATHPYFHAVPKRIIVSLSELTSIVCFRIIIFQ